MSIAEDAAADTNANGLKTGAHGFKTDEAGTNTSPRGRLPPLPTFVVTPPDVRISPPPQPQGHALADDPNTTQPVGTLAPATANKIDAKAEETTSAMEVDDADESEDTDSDPPITAAEDWNDGDFTIISADKVRFRVPSHIMMSAR